MPSELNSTGGLSFRGFGATVVVLQHTLVTIERPASIAAIYEGHLGWSQRFGLFCVDVFFGLSGFLLVRELAPRFLVGGPRRATLSGYALRRVARIFPAIWAIAVILAAVRIVRNEPVLWPFVHLVTLTQNYTHDEVPLLPQAWTLDLEIVFYLGLPLLALCLVRTMAPLRRAGWFLLVGALSWSLSPSIGILAGPQSLLVQQLLGPLDLLIVFLVGAAAQQVSELPWVVRNTRLFRLSAVGVAVILTLQRSLQYQHQKLWHLEAAVGTGCILLARPNFGRFFSWVGERSLSLYLVHLPLLGVLTEWSLFQARPLWVALSVAPAVFLSSLAVAHLAFRWVEAPPVRWARSFTRPNKSCKGAAAPDRVGAS